MSYTVRVTPQALKAMEDIHRYIAEELLSPEYAMGQYDRIADAIMSLRQMPARYPLVRFEPERTQGLHRMPVDHYSVFYLIRDEEIIVTTVLYSASDIVSRLSRQ